MAEKKKPEVSLNDLEKDLEAGNEAVQAYLTQHLVKQGYFNPDDESVDSKSQEQNDPKNKPKDTSDTLDTLTVAQGALGKKK